MTNRNWLRKGISALLALTMVLQYVPLSVFAAAEDNLCAHHPEHTAECGYAEESAGAPCTHVHGDACYAILACQHTCGDECAAGCTHTCTLESGCVVMEPSCSHVHGDCGYQEMVFEVLCGCTEVGEDGALLHTEGCGYVAAVEGAPCIHVCGVVVGSEDSCYALLCSHAQEGQHDESCGYREAAAGQACQFACAECAANAVPAEEGQAVTEESSPAPQSAEEDLAWDLITAELEIPGESEAATESSPVCSCGTDDPAIHATTCDLYVAPENPQCSCAEACGVESQNFWCDVCGFDYTKCGGIDTAAAYADDLTLQDTNGDGYYEISTADELYAFAAAVNGGDGAINGELTANIVVNQGTMTADTTGARVWTPIGNDTYAYLGTFDGGGHTISGLYFNDSTAYYVGLFGCLESGGTVKNLSITDSYLCGGNYVGGVVGYSYGNSIVRDCSNYGTVTGDSYVGGVVGNSFSATVTNCTNSGTVSGTQPVGGVVGYNSGNVISCYNTGTVTVTGSDVGGVAGYNSGTVTSCYNTGTVSGTYVVGGVVGYNSGTVASCYYLDIAADGGIKGGDVTDQAEAKTAEQFASGEVAYLLNGDQSTIVFKQTLGTDAYPSFTGGTVYRMTGCDGNTAYSNTNETLDHNYDNGFCTLCGDYESAADSNSDGVYEISNAGQLYWFAAQVNGGTTVDAILTQDITVNEGTMTAETTDARAWTPIGNEGKHYIGTFDGAGFTISGLYHQDNDADNVGLFGYVGENGTVKNVGIADSYFFGNMCVGSVAGYNRGTVAGCYNTGTVSGDVTIGGVVGSNQGTMYCCYNAGNVICRGSLVGGVVGEAGGAVMRCYNVGTITCSGSYVGGVAGDGNVTDCYYLDTTAEVGVGSNNENAQAEAKTAAQFASGEVACLLNNSPYYVELVFKQTLGENGDAYPSFTGATVYQVTGCDGNAAYSNTNENIDHNWVDGTCTGCNLVCDHSESEHTTATDNGNGTHSLTCTVCGGITEVHTFDENGTCVCGVNLFAVSGSTLTIDGTLGGKAAATEEDITVLVNKIQDCLDNGITTITVTGSEPAMIEISSLTITAIGEAIYRVSGSDYYDENNPYNGKIDLTLSDVTQIVDQEFYRAYALNSITLPKVTTVGDGAFYDCQYLKTITFGSAVTAINQKIAVFHRVGEAVDGCDLVLNCGQMEAEDYTYRPDLENNVWFKSSSGDTTWKSITLTHTLTYSASGNILNETCASGCGHQATATVAAEDTAYNGTEQKTATVSYSEGWMGGDVTVSYENNVKAGTATAKIALGEATASATFTIAPKTLSLNLTSYGKTYDGTPVLTSSKAKVAGFIFYEEGSYESDTLDYDDVYDDVRVDTDALLVTLPGCTVGEYTTAAVTGITLIGEDAANYTIASELENVPLAGKYGTFEIGKATITITSRNQNVELGADIDQNAYTVEGLPQNHEIRGVVLEKDGSQITVNTDTVVILNAEGVYVETYFDISSRNEGILTEVCQGHTFNENGFCATGQCQNYQSAAYDEENGVYQISNAGQLYWYANKLNTDNVEIHAELVKDIAIPDNAPNWQPITASYAYFNGNYHTISGLKCIGDENMTYVGLFGNENWWYEISNLHITDSYFEGSSYVGAVAACMSNGGSITNCYVTNTTVKGDGSNVGTLVGYLGGTASNCYTDSSSCIGYSSYATVENCCYLSDTETEDGGKTAAQFESGEVAYLLGSAFGQTIGTETYPVFGGKKVYQIANTGCPAHGEYGYSNDENTVFAPGHEYDKGVCGCGASCSHEGEQFTCTDNGDGTHDKVYTDCGYVIADNETHNGTPSYAVNKEDSAKHDVTYDCCGGTVTQAHTADETIGQTCKGYWCVNCEEWYGETSYSGHAFADDNETCKYCQKIIVAKLTRDGVVFCYTAIENVTAAVKGNGTTLTVLANITLTENVNLGYMTLEREGDVTITVPNEYSLSLSTTSGSIITWIDSVGVSQMPVSGGYRITYKTFEKVNGDAYILLKDYTIENTSIDSGTLAISEGVTLTVTGTMNVVAGGLMNVNGNLVLGENAAITNSGTVNLNNADTYKSGSDIPAGLTGGTVKINKITYTYVSEGSTDEKDSLPYWTCKNHTGGESDATCVTPANCENCGDQYEVYGDHSIDTTTGKCVYCDEYASVATATDGTTTLYAGNELQLRAVIEQLLTGGSRTITVVLSGDDMLGDVSAAVRTAVPEETQTVHLTVQGATKVAEGHGLTGLVQLASLSLPDVTYLGEKAMQNTYLQRLGLTAEEEITVEREIIDSNRVGNVDLVLCCNKVSEVTDGVTWNGNTFKSVTFRHNYVDGICTVCGVPCDHKDSTHTTANNGDGTHSFVCSVCNTAVTEDHTFNETGKCVCTVQATAKVNDYFNGIATYYYGTLPEALAAAEVLSSDGVGDSIGVDVYPLADDTGDFTIPAGLIYFNGEGYTFSGTVTNNGYIFGGIFSGEVKNNSYIYGGTFNGKVTNDNTIINTDSGKMELGENFSIENKGSIICHVHFWKDGVCRLCAEACAHTHGTPSYTWTEDPITLTVSVSCTACGATLTGSTTDMDKISDDGFTTTYTATVTLDGKAYTDSKTVSNEVTSVSITWGTMDFTYTDGSGWNNPDTAWVQVENTGNTDVSVTYTYDTEREDIRGSFTDGTNAVTEAAVAAENCNQVWLELDGKPGEALNNTTIGSVKLTIE